MSVNKSEVAAFISDLYAVERELPQARQALLTDLAKLLAEAGEHTPGLIIEAKALRLAQNFAANIGKRIEGGAV
ncbi:Hypothetical protein DPCES_5179 [Desulfitobacterium hafniense]|uniref:Uncharacterized protein n=1 Tax=Desulfitobacterium hafniense TaxID=49338 RepID=A0A098B9L7_DESHA|nr:hypothetical protein [Desulfitobacterium hafniense]CDX05065.1 Hypothetical protein DPCES_5179 [Desulfitobacterium hafniense]